MYLHFTGKTKISISFTNTVKPYHITYGTIKQKQHLKTLTSGGKHMTSAGVFGVAFCCKWLGERVFQAQRVPKFVCYGSNVAGFVALKFIYKNKTKCSFEGIVAGYVWVAWAVYQKYYSGVFGVFMFL